MEGAIRNALAAIAVIISLGTSLGAPLIKMNTAIVVLQEQVSALTVSVNSLTCELRTKAACPYGR